MEFTVDRLQPMDRLAVGIRFTLELSMVELDRLPRSYQDWLLAVIRGGWGVGTNAMLLRGLAEVIEDAPL